MSSDSRSHQPRLLLAAGPRAAEARLLDEVARAARAREEQLCAGDATALRRPLRIVVPSLSLRRHVAARLVAHAGGSLLGVQVQTHVALAFEALARAGWPAPRGSALIPVLVRRHAAAEPVLARWLGELDDGYGIVDGAVRDLLDAGFDAASAEAFEEAIAAVQAEDELSATAVARAQAVGRVALQTLAVLAAQDLGHRTALLARARDALHGPGASPEALLPTAGLWVHGFADATGLVVEWLEALVRAFSGRVVVDVPADPAAPERREDRYAKEFCDRLRDATGGEEAIDAPPGIAAPAAIALLRAPGSAAELRAVAARIRARLDAGDAPESIGIVAPSFEPYRAALAAQLGRLGIPFSCDGVSAGPDAATRRITALGRVLADGAAAPMESWLDADGRPDAADPDLRVALHALGAGRLGQVAALDLDAALGDPDSLRLSVRRGGAVGEGGAAHSEPDTDEDQRATAAARNRRRRVSRGRLEEARTRAEAALAALGRWPDAAPFAAHVEALRALLDGPLAWRSEQPDEASASQTDGDGGLAPIDALAREIPEDFELTREEATELFVAALADASQSSVGGAGAGVQVLTFTAARARTFARLFVLGMNRGVFPRVASDDPVLPDALRARIRRDVLSEMPVKGRLRDEERAQFASLCAAAPHVVLAWQAVNDEGRTRVESPFLTRLRVSRSGGELPEILAPPVFALAPASDPEVAAAPRPAHEHAVLAGLAGASRHAGLLEQVHEIALAEVRDTLHAEPSIGDPALAALDIGALARVHATALRGLDVAPFNLGDGDGAVPSLGPWFGWVGASSRPASELFVTRLEQLARCPWQAFLRRELGLEPVPDALEDLPEQTRQMAGRVVDRVLGRVVDEALPAPREQLAAALAAGPVPAPWPAPDVLERWLADAARAVVVEAGVALPGFAAALARRVRPLLATARAVDWGEPDGLPVLGAELEAVLDAPAVDGAPRRIGFRADRVDLSADGTLRITDYKAGTPISTAKKASTRQQHLLEAIRRGEKLQAVVYHVVGHALAPGRAVEGRYLFLREDLADDARALAVADDAYGINAVDAMHATLTKLFRAADHGAFVPRLDTPEGQAPCSSCEVSAACLRGDHAHRARLTAWIDAASASAPQQLTPGLTPTESAALAVLRLPAEAKAAGREDRQASDPGEEE